MNGFFFLLQKMEKDCGKGQERRVAGGKKHLWKIFSNFFFLFSSFKKEGETESKIGSEAERERRTEKAAGNFKKLLAPKVDGEDRQMAKCAALKVELKDAVNELAGRSTERQIQASGRGIVKLAGNCLFFKKNKNKKDADLESQIVFFFRGVGGGKCKMFFNSVEFPSLKNVRTDILRTKRYAEQEGWCEGCCLCYLLCKKDIYDKDCLF